MDSKSLGTEIFLAGEVNKTGVLGNTTTGIIVCVLVHLTLGLVWVSASLRAFTGTSL